MKQATRGMQRNTYKGFTLIELMVVMALMAVLATLIIGAISLARAESVRGAHRANARTVQAWLENISLNLKKFCSTTHVNYMLDCNDSLGNTQATLYSFKAIGAIQKTLSKSPCSSASVTFPARAGVIHTVSVEGGGYVWASPTGYTVVPVNDKCDTVLEDDIITME